MYPTLGGPPPPSSNNMDDDFGKCSLLSLSVRISDDEWTEDDDEVGIIFENPTTV